MLSRPCAADSKEPPMSGATGASVLGASCGTLGMVSSGRGGPTLLLLFKFILFEEVSENFLDLNISKHNGID